jgi:hypothetical protein
MPSGHAPSKYEPSRTGESVRSPAPAFGNDARASGTAPNLSRLDVLYVGDDGGTTGDGLTRYARFCG